jgi:uncharacterized protein (TIGR04255 family)
MAEFISETFEKAPLVEVALSVQFQPLQLFTSAHAGEFWQLVRGEFSVSQEQPPLGPIGEFFGQSRSAPNFPPFAIQMGFSGVRNWFSTPDGTFLLQLQRDRFALNWRKTPTSPDYPRYPAIRKKFIELFKIFDQFTEGSGLGKCEINIHEASYINQWFFHDDQKIGDGLGSWLSLAPNNVAALEMEAANINVQYIVSGEGSQPIGRLYVNVTPIFAINGKNGINLELICRVIPLDLGDEFLFHPLDLARQNIVTTFKQITSDSAQKVWRGE